MLIEESVIDMIRDQANIVSIIDAYVPLKKRGTNYLGLCPFHVEKSPSFSVSPAKRIYHCFGCSEGGNVISFLMKIEHISFVEAVQMLADKVGISLDIKPSAPENPTAYQILNEASLYFQHHLSTPAVKEYLLSRQLSAKTITNLSLGYAPNEWEELFNYLKKKGFAETALIQSGLFIQKETRIYNRFRDRLIFPIFDLRDRVIAFGGRLIHPAETSETPKYLNSPETSLYVKSDVLYGLSLAKDAVRQHESIILVEGYMDFVAFYQQGIRQVAATLGTAFTDQHVRLIKRFTTTVYLCFDMDAAGRQACLRAGELLQQSDTKCYVLTYPGKDPDDFFHSHTPVDFEKIIEEAKPFTQYRLNLILADYHSESPESKSETIQRVADYLQTIKDEVIVNEYIKYCATSLAIEPEILKNKLQRLTVYSSRKDRGVIKPTRNKFEGIQEELLYYLLVHPSIRERVILELSSTDFLSVMYIQLMDFILHHVDLPLDLMIEKMSDDSLRELATRLAMQPLPETMNERVWRDLVIALKRYRHDLLYHDLCQSLGSAQKTGDLDIIKKITQQISEMVVKR